MYCLKCGSEIPDESSFCYKCGEQLTEVKKDSGVSQNEVHVEQKEKEITKIKKHEPKKIFWGVVIAVIMITLLKGMIGGTESTSEIKLGKFKSSEELKVIGAFVNDNYCVVAVENVSEKTVRDYDVAFVGFDAAGNAIKLDNDKWYKTGIVDTANILPGNSYGLDSSFSCFNDAVVYVEATVSSITFTDGTTWTADNIESWADDTTSAFSVDDYKAKVENMKAFSMQAETNPYVKIVAADKYDDNQFSSSDDLDITYKNIGTQDIRRIEAIVMEYDENGYAINVSPYSYVTINCRKISFDDANLVAGGSCCGNNTLLFEGNCERFKVLITELEFVDGTKWTNNNAFQWIVYNENERKD